MNRCTTFNETLFNDTHMLMANKINAFTYYQIQNYVRNKSRNPIYMQVSSQVYSQILDKL